MGCDIHMVIEVRPLDSDRWVLHGEPTRDNSDPEYPSLDMPEPYSGRNYNLFAVLADVRNGYGFAGVDTGDRIEPVSLPRGIPEDASPEYAEWAKGWDVDGHSHSWLTLAELLAYDWTRPKTSRGWLTMKEYAKWVSWGKSRGEQPEGWCGGVSGGAVRHVSNKDADALIAGRFWNDIPKELDSTYTQCEWTVPLVKTIGPDLFAEVIAPMLALSQTHGQDGVRIVFFFDN